MNQLIAQAAEVQRVTDARGWRSCIIGGLAVIRWGEPRLTRDVGIARQRSLDWSVIVARLSPLAELKGEPRILLELDRIRADAAGES